MGKPLMLFCVLLLLSVSSFAQEAEHTKLSRRVKDSLREEIETMLANDQKYRWMLMYGELDEQKIAEFKKMDESAKFKRFIDVQKNKVGISEFQKDSLWNLQSPIDSINFFELKGIILKYGFPNKYVEVYKATTFLLHATPRWMTNDFFKILLQEVKSGNLPAKQYASIYDKKLLDQKLPRLYYVDENYDPMTGKSSYGKPVNIDETNKAREEIGLEKFSTTE